MAGSTHSSSSEVTSGQKQKLPSSGPSESRSRTTSEEAPQESSVQRLDSQEAPAKRDLSPSPSPSPAPAPAPAPAPKPVRSRLKIEKQVELLEVCTRWIRLYVHDKNGGKTFWDKVHEVLENAGTKYSADSCKNFVTSTVHNYEQRAPIEEELEGPLRAWKLAVDDRKREEQQKKIDQEKAKKEKAEKKKADKEKAEKGRAEKKADKEKADKEKADREKADQEKADQEKADKEKTAKRSGSKIPAASTKKPIEASRTTVPDSQEDTEANSAVDTSIPSIESDPVARQPKRRLADLTAVGESPPKRPRTRSCTAQNEGRRPMGKTRAASLQPGQTQRRPSVPPRQVADPAAKPTATVPPSSKPGEKRKGPAPKASEDDAPESSTRPAKKGKTTNDFLGEIANGLDSHLTRLETNIDEKFEGVKKELEVLKVEIAELSQWHVQLNDAINHERGIAIKEASNAEARDTSEAVVNTAAEVEEVEQSSGNEDELKSTDENDESKSTDEDAEPTTRGAKLETIHEITEITEISISEKIEQQAPEGEDLSRKDTTAAESSGDDPSSSSSDEDEEVPAPVISKPPGWHA